MVDSVLSPEIFENEEPPIIKPLSGVC